MRDEMGNRTSDQRTPSGRYFLGSEDWVVKLDKSVLLL